MSLFFSVVMFSCIFLTKHINTLLVFVSKVFKQMQQICSNFAQDFNIIRFYCPKEAPQSDEHQRFSY